ncbi:hypothetical protein CPB86DRAFT_728722 [Serendipita vermifera]|nr:hypothetical protein CPB86DRAFT_728722 [Serendipita vermifera]
MSAVITSSEPTGTGITDPLGEQTSATIELNVSTLTARSCEPMNITWTVTNGSANVDISTITLSYTNVGVSQTEGDTTYHPTSGSQNLGVTPVSRLVWTWPAVFIQESGYYVIQASGSASPAPSIKQTPRFLVTVDDMSCFIASSPSSSTSDLSTLTDAPSAPSNSPTEYSAPSPKKTNVGAIVGGTVTAVALLALLAAWLLFRRRRRSRESEAVDSSPTMKKGHRKWGGLSSIDKLQQGEIPVVIPSNSPYATQSVKRNRSQSTGRAMTDEEALEKDYENDIFPVDASALAEMPALNSKRESRRYSSDVVSAMLRQRSGLAAFNEQYDNRAGVGGVASPVVSTTTATVGGGDDPFSDAAFMSRSKRISALSVPSTARTPSRVSDISNRGPPSPLPQSNPPSQANTMSRNGSASVGRPTRKPVPQYTDDSIELTNTSKSSPTTPSPLSPQARYGNTSSVNPSYADLSTSHSTNHLAESYDSVSPWLERAPVANRNIGLAGQTDGPVHYLIPDLPPPPRN